MVPFARVNVRVAAPYARLFAPMTEGSSLHRDPSTGGSLGLVRPWGRLWWIGHDRILPESNGVVKPRWIVPSNRYPGRQPSGQVRPLPDCSVSQIFG